MIFLDWGWRTLFTKTSITLMFIAALMGCKQSSPQDAEQKVAKPLQKITVAYTYQP